MRITAPLAALAFLLLIAPAQAQPGDLPSPDVTPGLARSDMTVEQMCATKWGKDERHVTDSMKAQVYAEYGITVPKVHGRYRFPKTAAGKPAYEVDHVISRELLGADDIKNLWPESYTAQPWNAHKKDRLENWLHKEVCAGRISLTQAQNEIATDWIAAYRKYIAP